MAVFTPAPPPHKLVEITFEKYHHFSGNELCESQHIRCVVRVHACGPQRNVV